MKIAVVCSHGGHFTEMTYLQPSFDGTDFFYVTYDSPRTRQISGRKYLFPNFGREPYRILGSLHRMVMILLREKPDLMVSNGAEIAIPFFYIARLLGIRTLFIECYTRVNKPTFTGKAVYPLASEFLALWPEMLKRYGKKAKFWGGLVEVICDYETPDVQQAEDPRSLILVMAGTHYLPFNRLIMKMDEIAERKHLRVLVLTGPNSYNLEHAESMSFIGSDREVIGLIRESRMVVCQGAMTIIEALLEKRPVIAVPRLREFGEHIDNHQLDFSRKMEELGVVRTVTNVGELDTVVSQTGPLKGFRVQINPHLIRRLRNQLGNPTTRPESD